VTRGDAYVEPPQDARAVSVEGPRPFVTHVHYRLGDGRVLEWVSRRHRKSTGGALGWWIAVLFIVGSACFAVGSLPGYASLAGAAADGVTYFVGSIFFTGAAYLQYVECISAPRNVIPEARRRARLLAVEARRIDWWATSIQLAGTIFFNVTTFTALDAHLTGKQQDLVVWTPDALGSICFLVASELAYAEAGHAWFSWRPGSMGWRIAAVNLLGSVFFGISAIAGWVQPSTGNLLDAALDTSGTFLGAICFLIGAALLLVPDPGAAPNEAGAVSVATG
jgi:YrhK-like protein